MQRKKKKKKKKKVKIKLYKSIDFLDPLHRGPTDHKRSVGPLLSLPEVHDQFFSFAHVQRERQLSLEERLMRKVKGHE